MNKQQRLDILLQKYVESETEEFQRAKKMITARAKLQDEIKKTMKQLGITEHYINFDTIEARISFKVCEYEKVDTDVMPEDIKVQYLKIQEIWRENLEVIRRA